MNIDDILQLVQDFRSQLEVWGVNSEALMVVGAVAALLFILSLREVATWFFRVNQVRDEVRGLRAQMNELRQLLLETHDAVVTPEAPVIPMKPEELIKAAEELRETPKFRLDH